MSKGLLLIILGVIGIIVSIFWFFKIKKKTADEINEDYRRNTEYTVVSKTIKSNSSHKERLEKVVVEKTNIEETTIEEISVDKTFIEETKLESLVKSTKEETKLESLVEPTRIEDTIFEEATIDTVLDEMG